MKGEMEQEIYNVQNPAIGATILWRFICGYYAENRKLVPFPLLFIVLPIIFNEDLYTVIKSTRIRSGLAKVSEKLYKDKNNDRLFSVQTSALSMRALTLCSFNMGMAANLFAIDFSTAYVFPLLQKMPTHISTTTTKLLGAAEKLGGWCEDLSLLEICSMLKVRF